MLSFGRQQRVASRSTPLRKHGHPQVPNFQKIVLREEERGGHDDSKIIKRTERDLNNPKKKIRKVSNEEKEDRGAGASEIESSSEAPILETEKQNRGKNVSGARLSTLQSRMLKKLSSGRFRYLNEQLYTNDANTMFEEMKKNPEIFRDVSIHFI